MMNNKNYLSTIIAVLTLLTVLSGCGKEVPNSELPEADIYAESDQAG